MKTFSKILLEAKLMEFVPDPLAFSKLILATSNSGNNEIKNNMISFVNEIMNRIHKYGSGTNSFDIKDKNGNLIVKTPEGINNFVRLAVANYEQIQPNTNSRELTSLRELLYDSLLKEFNIEKQTDQSSNSDLRINNI